MNKINTGSYGREGEVEFGVLVDIFERAKGGIEFSGQLDIFPRGLEVRPASKPEINSKTPPSEEMELFLKIQAFALKLFQKPKI